MHRPAIADEPESPHETEHGATGRTQADPTWDPGDFSRPAWGWGLATVHASGIILDTYYPQPALGLPKDASAPEELAMAAAGTSSGDPLRAVHTDLVRTLIDLDEPPANAPDTYLRLHLLSHRLVEPRTINLSGMFANLINVAWTSLGPCAIDGFENVRTRLKADRKEVIVYGVDKVPRMVDYVLPSGVRIANADRVRLGAHLAPGTVVMHEGFVDYNAGTLGSAMVKGRLSQGVMVGENSDVGSNASIMGTLSDGGTEMVAIGDRCLIGANAGTDIALGDDCVVESGLYVTTDTKIVLSDGETIKATRLSGRSNLLFLRNSVTGAVEARDRTNSAAEATASQHPN